MKSVGVIGGLGPETTAEFYLEVIFQCQKRNTDSVALACTDLQLLLPSSNKVPIFDTMKVLAESTVETILS